MPTSRRMKIGVISDTHDFLDPRVAAAFEGVDHILHGGDVGGHGILQNLRRIAPVTAVLGNTDGNLPVRDAEYVELGEYKFLVQHIVEPAHPDATLRQRLLQFVPDVVVFGHTHKPFAEWIGPTFYFNPGYAGRQRFDLKRSLALLELSQDGISHQFIPL